MSTQHYGQWGVITSIGPRIQCHLCGRGYDSLATHVWKTHGISPTDYRKEFGLPPTFGLTSDRLHCKFRQKLNQLVADGHKGFRASSRRDKGEIAPGSCVECGGTITQRKRLDHGRLLCNRPACRFRARQRHARKVNSARSPEHQRQLNESLQRWQDAHRRVHPPVTCRNPLCGQTFAYVRRKVYCTLPCSAAHRSSDPVWRERVSGTWFKPGANKQ